MKWGTRFALALVALIATLAAPPWRLPHQARDGEASRRIPLEIGDDPGAQAEMEFLMLRDPRTGEIPASIRRREALFARALPVRDARGRSEGDRANRTQSLTWTERGPNNVGGRTRVFAVDVANPATLIAGSVAGGLWKSLDDGATWTIRTAPAQLHGMTCIAQDVRPGATQVWYAGTGEIRGSTTNDTRWGSLYRGDGIFKSTDNGDSWTLLPSTTSGTPQVSDEFDFVVNLATNPANLVNDEVLAATHLGIQRSLDGGGSWNTVLPSDSGFTDVAITAAGVRYASTRGVTGIAVWRSTDGVNWTSIEPAAFPSFAGRVVIGLSRSQPSTVYFFVQGANNGPAVNGHQLWKFEYLSGNGSGAGGTWSNRGANLPADLSTQAAYDMIVHVHPTDPDFVIVGGTNLYRSTNGFQNIAATTVIGGYPYWPDGQHHPDLHAGGFSPVDPDAYYSAGDGGVSKTASVSAQDVEWATLNHGYNVTQFYSVSIAPDAGSNRIMAGAQDNGTQMGDAPGASDWTMAFGGDGTVVKVSPAASDRLYTQYQGGQMQRQNWDGSDLADITPSGASNQLFVNPIVLDPNDPSLLYYPAGVSSASSRIWRNDTAPIATDVTGWSSLAATEVGAGSGYTRRITALGISSANDANVLYFGTVDGIVKRAANVHTGAPTVTTISPPGLNAGTSSGGFVRCIAVDPTDSDRALVCFGNYNFLSLWYTTDGGASWTDVEGNLAGAAGPSVRWASMFDLDGQLQVFLGTSIGVLSTGSLAGVSTVWVREADEAIGNVIIAYMDYRASDRTLAVATHGRGVFTTQFAPNVSAPEPARTPRVVLGPISPNPARNGAWIAYELPAEAEVSLKLFDVAGRRVATMVDARQDAGRHSVRLETVRLAPGAYLVVLRAGGAIEQRRLTVTK